MRIAAIAAAGIGVGMLAWFVVFLRYNRRRGQAFLDRLRLSWRAKILGFRWQGCSSLHAGLEVPSHSIRTAHITLQLAPRPLPWKWFLAWYRSEQETLAIESDLESPPAFSLVVRNHRWSGRVGNLKCAEHGWQVNRPGPILLTTQEEWDAEHNPVMNALLAARHSEFTEVHLQPHSPHLAAQLPLEALVDFSVAGHVLETLRELAAGSRAPKN